MGIFLDVEYPRKIISENLFVNETPIFQRTDNLYIGNMDIIRNYLSDATDHNIESVSEIAKSSLSQDELFLTNGFKLIFHRNLQKSLLIGLQINLWLYIVLIQCS